jgi:hypothetical protein
VESPDSKNVLYKAVFRLRPVAGKTTVQLAATLSTDSSFYTFTVPILRQLALRELCTDLQALKIAVENDLE